MATAHQKSQNAANRVPGETRDPAAHSEARRLGRCVTLEFVGDDVPVMDRIAFKPKQDAAAEFWKRGHATKGFTWTEVPQALAILFVEYAAWGRTGQPQEYFFTGKCQGSLAASLGDAIHKNDHRLHDLFVESLSDGKTVSRVKNLFDGSRGDNVHGKARDGRDRRIAVSRNYLPPDCVELFWNSRGPLVELGDVQLLANRVRESLGLQTPINPPATSATRIEANAPQKPSATSAQISADLKSKIEEARLATRKHADESAVCLWEEVRKQAKEETNKAVEIEAQFELALLDLRSGGDLDEVVSILDKCIQEAKSVDLGNDRSRLLQLLGEAHRVKGNLDQARGYITSAIEHSRSLGHKLDEGWALLALSALEKAKAKGTVSEVGLDLTRRAYDCFSSVYVSGDQEKQRAAKVGFAACHSWRAVIFEHLRLDDAMAEFARALDVIRELGPDFEWKQAEILFERGDLHSRADDPELAAKDFIAAAEIFKRIGDHHMEAKSVLGIAELLDKRGARLDSKQYYEAAAAITVRQKLNQRAGAWIWFRYACKLLELREFEEAKSIFKTLLAADWLRPGQRLDVLKMLCMSAMGSGQKEELELYSKAALEIIDDQIAKATSPDARRRLIISKGKSLEELGEHDRAVACFRRGIEAFAAVNDGEGIIECWFNIAGVMGKAKKRKEEREAYEKILNLVGDGKDGSFFLPMTLTMLAQLEIFEKRFEEARKLLDRAEQTNEKLQNPMVIFLLQDLRCELPPV